MVNIFSTIKSKLIIGLSLMTLLIILSSIGGMLSVFSLERQINTITDKAGPIIEETDDLITGLWESAKVANEILTSEDMEEVKVLAKELESLSASFKETHQVLIEVVDNEEYLVLIEQASVEHKEFEAHAKLMIDSHFNELLEEEKAKSLLDEFDSISQGFKPKRVCF